MCCRHCCIFGLQHFIDVQLIFMREKHPIPLLSCRNVGFHHPLTAIYSPKELLSEEGSERGFNPKLSSPGWDCTFQLCSASCETPTKFPKCSWKVQPGNNNYHLFFFFWSEMGVWKWRSTADEACEGEKSLPKANFSLCIPVSSWNNNWEHLVRSLILSFLLFPTLHQGLPQPVLSHTGSTDEINTFP